MDNDRIERSVHVAASPERVWATLTQPELLTRWFPDKAAEVDLRPGGDVTLTWEHGTVRGRVAVLDEPRAFGFDWLHGDAGAATQVRFTLAAADGGTLLTVVETGFRDVPEPDQTWTDHLGGWKSELDELVTLYA